jgi:TonB-linked SusC/RagA family outer membrane protein
MNTIFRRVVVSGLALALVGTTGMVAQQTTGTITGRVVGTGAAGGPLETARVSVVGTNLATGTNREGVYTLRGVPAGSHQVRVIRLGYSQRTLPVTVTAGQTATLDFSLEPAPYTLEEITTTSTGEARKLEVGNTINTIQVNTLVDKAPIRDLTQIITARAPGVTVMPTSGTTGTGPRIRIRGANSVSLSNEPLYIIDGVRVNSTNNSPNNLGFGLGAQQPSRLADINVEDISDIQILKGPSASAIYGTGSSNGVVLITTKRGVAGRARWNLWMEQGVLEDNNDYPLNVFGGTTSDPTTAARCRLIQTVGVGTPCQIAQIFRYTPMTDPGQTPLATGRRQQWGGSVSGGSDAVQYFVSGEWEEERNVLQMPEDEQTRILEESGRSELREDELHPNNQNKWSLRANTNFVISPKATASVNIGYVNNRTRFPQNDNNVLGILSSSLNGDGRGATNPALAWGFFRPGETFQRLTVQAVNRITAAATTNYNPYTWLTLRATGGLDITEIGEQQLQRFNEGANFGTQRQGFAGEARTNWSIFTADVGGTASFDLTSRVTSKSSAGFQYSENNLHGTNGNGDILPPGSVAVTATSIKRLVEQTQITKVVGGYAEQVFGLDDRFFLTGSVRFDKNSSTGIEAKTIVYPKAAASWLTPWFESGTISSLRLRGSFGQAGQQPGGTQALETYTATQSAISGVVSPAVVLGNFGDVALKAERSTEFEGGFDLGLFDSRVAVEVTAFRKTTKDALINVTTPPSAGNPAGQFRNAGKVKNEGLELVVNAQVLNQQELTWDVTFSGSLSRNRLLELPPSIPNIIVNTNGTQQHRECEDDGTCYPLGGYWERKYTYDDANGNGVIEPAEVTVEAQQTFIGSPQPTRELALNTQLSLFRNRVQIGTTLDYRGGYYQWNLANDFRCRSRFNCNEMYDINAPLDEQARMIANTQKGALNTTYGYIEKSDFLKWREASITFNAPDSWARAIRGDRLSFTVTGRNLAKITDYTGVDPEVNEGVGNFAVRDFLALPLNRTVSFRANLTF